MPRSFVNPAVCENLPIFSEIKFTFHESICELSGVNGKGTDVTSDDRIIFTLSLTKNHFKNSCAAAVRCTKNQRYEMGINSQWNWRRRGHRKHRTSDINTRTRTWCLAEFKILNKKGGNNSHTSEGSERSSELVAPRPKQLPHLGHQ